MQTFREALEQFKRLAAKCHTPAARRALLQAFAVIQLKPRRMTGLTERRAQWARRTAKMNPHDWEGHECFVCGGRATQRHHVIPLARGGLATKKNTVWIDRDCHKAIHPWM